MPLSNSSGLTPCRNAWRSVSQSDLEKLCWTTASAHHHSGRQLEEDAKNESMNEVQGIGHRDTKYLPFRYTQTPLIGRWACKYTQELCARPLGDHLGNNDFAASMKDNEFRAMPSKEKRSLHNDSWRSFSSAQMQEAKPGLAFYTMAKTDTLNDTGARTDKLSFSHRNHHGRSERFCNSGTVPPASDGLFMSGRGGALGNTLRAGDCFRSRYADDFWNYSFSASLPSEPGKSPSGTRPRSSVSLKDR
eukprot:TRINITY_DN78075_c0_g1_i1.p1 TRINITY_DN78075_c0_g1~~TRINITY_DN78075_c0_g1_i1.p1  ORF type:complete len:247 (-),score=30.22 TRINITY_DN78075_c0_g1_i1:56-796(-)